MLKHIKRIYSLWNKVNSLVYQAYLRTVGVDFGSQLKLRGIPYIYANMGSKITLGNRVTLASSELSNPIGVNHRCVIRTITEQASVRVGDDVGITGSTLLSRTKIIIENGVLIGANCTITDSDLHPHDPDKRRRMDDSEIECAPVIIEENVWLGMNVIVLKGVTIGRNTIIGAGSVVTRSIPANVIAAGNPARVIRELEHPRE